MTITPELRKRFEERFLVPPSNDSSHQFKNSVIGRLPTEILAFCEEEIDLAVQKRTEDMIEDLSEASKSWCERGPGNQVKFLRPDGAIFENVFERLCQKFLTPEK